MYCTFLLRVTFCYLWSVGFWATLHMNSRWPSFEFCDCCFLILVNCVSWLCASFTCVCFSLCSPGTMPIMQEFCVGLGLGESENELGEDEIQSSSDALLMPIFPFINQIPHPPQNPYGVSNSSVLLAAFLTQPHTTRQRFVCGRSGVTFFFNFKKTAKKGPFFSI